MEKISVKKPFTVLVAVIVVLALGVVSMMQMTTDLLPEMSLPYLMIVTPYPGASPEKVETEVSQPLENALGVIKNVKNINSVSAENYCMVQMEFVSGTNMDSAMVNVSSAVNQVAASLPDLCGTPSILELGMNMIATMYVAVSREDFDIFELSEYVDREVIPAFQRQNGVASVTAVGLVEKSVQIDLNRQKIAALNDLILEKANSALAEARQKLDDAQAQVDEGQAELERQQAQFGSMLAGGIFRQLDAPARELGSKVRGGVNELVQQMTMLQTQMGAAAGQTDGEVDLLEEATARIGDALTYLQDNLEGGQELIDDVEALVDDAMRLQEETERAVQLAFIKAMADGGVTEAGANAAQARLELRWSALRQTQTDLKATLGELRKSVINAHSEEPDDEIPSPTEAYETVRAAWAALKEAVPPTAQALKEEMILAGLAVEALPDALRAAGYAVGHNRGIYMLQQQLDKTIRDLNTVLDSMRDDTIPSLIAAAAQLELFSEDIRTLLDQISAQDAVGELGPRIEAARTALSSLSQDTDRVPNLMQTLEMTYAGLTQGQLDAAVGFALASQQLALAQTQLGEAFAQYDAARDKALSTANIDTLVDASTLSQLIYAQNFAMPAGYIDDKDDNSWLLRVGDEYGSETDIGGALLSDIEGVGTIRITDIADITVIDNAGMSYANLDGKDGIMLCVYKSSTAGTNAVSKACSRAIRELIEEDGKLSIVKMVDQGKYITLIVNSILESMGLGAILAIVVLALFLKDLRPTFIVGISIPLSVLFALVLMYFTKLSLNMMTLSGLALGIGMLVDNSIVVMENVVRLKSRGMTAPRAAVQGTKQVAGSIIASTLTTISVFVPMIFTSGTVREMLVPLALSVSYCLVASLLVAMTVIPASASTILSRIQPKRNRLMERIQRHYGGVLRWCLGHKAIPLLLSIGLLVMCVVQMLAMGIVVLPEMTSDTINVTINTDEGIERDRSYAVVDEVMNAMLTVDGIDSIGIMDYGSVMSSVGTLAGSGSGSYGNYICFVTLPDGAGKKTVMRLVDEIRAKTAGIDCSIDVSTGSMADFSAMMSSGLSVDIFGSDLAQLQSIAHRVADAVRQTEGFVNVSDGSEETSATLHLVIDKDKAMRYGLTVAQIYSQIAKRLATDVTGTSITVDGFELDVTVRNNTDPLTRENLLDMEFTAVNMGDIMNGGNGMGGMGSMSGMGSMMGVLTGAGAVEDTDLPEVAEDDSIHRLREFATLEETNSASAIRRENLTRYVSVTAAAAEGYNTTVLTRELQKKLDTINKELPSGYSIVVGGESEQVNDMVVQMLGLAGLGLLFIYLVMVAQFQSLLSPFIILFTVPLAFTGGMLGLIIAGQQMSMLSLMGFLILMGTVVNNGIVFVDYTNQLRLGGMQKWDALVAAGQTRMRPILMTTLTTILAMAQLMFGDDMGSQLGGGMAIVIAGGLLYATLMTLFIIPVMYDILFRKQPHVVDVGDDLNDVPDDAAEFLAALAAEKEAAQAAETPPDV